MVYSLVRKSGLGVIQNTIERYEDSKVKLYSQ